MFCEVYHLYNLLIHKNSKTLFSCNIHEATVKVTSKVFFLFSKDLLQLVGNSQVIDLMLSYQYDLPKNEEKTFYFDFFKAFLR